MVAWHVLEYRPVKVVLFTCAMILIVGCHATPNIPESEPIHASQYLSGSTHSHQTDANTVFIAPIGIRCEPEPADGERSVIVDIWLEGPPAHVRDIAHALKYRFFS